MRSKITALVAAAAAAVSAAGIAKWAQGRKDADQPDLEVSATDLPPKIEPVPVVEPAPSAAGLDDLTAIKGLGQVKAAKLVAIGITSYAQIAAWSDDDIAEVGLSVNTSPGQIKREDWVGQARALAES